ncbi:efflux RND transporter periplasmic adaptor subunit [Halorhodospira halochloris]|uniref:efflux RND transporter periplasmic adaptor subunit n=1 Tax=Halorhodospira halochloris TaxID=1052 RepID=UPI001EE97279|nr:efflux RND transporter periplasmic adaptor subunit [Halorhodospira halochloris]MCG5547583.1 efflux RND transporter periplasmic adaptor subunit [Halorhodospira halochloris]
MLRQILGAVARRWVWLLSACIAAGAAAIFLIEGGPADGERDRDGRGVAVEVGTIERRDMRDIRRLDGSLEALSSYEVAPKIGAEIRSVEVRIGDVVEHGDLLARLDQREIEQEVAQAEAELEVARAELAERESTLQNAERELSRTRDLREREIASAADLEAAEAQVAAERSRKQLAEARIAQRQAALSAARIRLSFTEIRADWEGGEGERVVGERFIDPGATVSANEPILSLLDLSELRAVTFVSERDYGLISPGQGAQLSVSAYPQASFDAEVVRLAPLFQAGTRQARVELRVPNPQGLLRPGMFTRVSLQVDKIEDALTVPYDAIARRGGRTVIYPVTPEQDEDGEEVLKARQVAVEVGLRSDDRVVVRPVDGELGEGAQVVTLGQHLIGEQAEVEIVGEQLEAL